MARTPRSKMSRLSQQVRELLTGQPVPEQGWNLDTLSLPVAATLRRKSRVQENLSTLYLRDMLKELAEHQDQLEDKNAELLLARNRFSHLYDFAPVGYFTLDAGGVSREANQTAATQLGQERGSLIGAPLTRWFGATNVKKLEQHIESVFQSAAPQACEVEWNPGGGRPLRYFLFESAPNLDEELGQVMCHTAISDITQLRVAERELMHTQEQWRSLVEHAPDYIVMVDRAGKMLFVNRVAAHTTMDKVIGKTVYDFLLPEYREMQREAFRKVFEDGESVYLEIHAQLTNGDKIWFGTRMGPIRVGGKITAAVLISTDITFRKQAEAALHQANERYMHLLSRLADHFIYAHDTRGVFHTVSPSVTQMIGYSTAEFKQHYTRYLTDHPMNKEVVRLTDLCLAGKPQPPYELEIRHKDGHKMMLRVSEIPIRDAAGQVIGVEGIAYDITALKAEQERQRATLAKLRDVLEDNK